MTVMTDYLGSVYQTDRFRKTVDSCVAKIQSLRETIKFDSIAFTGQSGAAMAYVLSYQLGIPLICVRKENDDTHYYGSGHFAKLIEGYVAEDQKYLIVDDLVSSGETIRRIQNIVDTKIPGSKCVGVVLYNTYHYQEDTLKDPPRFGCKV